MHEKRQKLHSGIQALQEVFKVTLNEELENLYTEMSKIFQGQEEMAQCIVYELSQVRVNTDEAIDQALKRAYFKNMYYMDRVHYTKYRQSLKNTIEEAVLEIGRAHV